MANKICIRCSVSPRAGVPQKGMLFAGADRAEVTFRPLKRVKGVRPRDWRGTTHCLWEVEACGHTAEVWLYQ